MDKDTRENMFNTVWAMLALVAFLSILVAFRSCAKDRGQRKMECISAGVNPTECDRIFVN